MIEVADSAGTEGVAIVGIACRYPGGVNDARSFWHTVASGVDTITEIPADRIDLASWYDPRPATAGQMSSRVGGYLERLQAFDAGFFEMSPREAERLDPQQRLLLETAWEALEDAGIDPTTLDGSRTGVFVGQWLSDFEGRLFARPEQLDFFMLQGSGRYASSGRLSYALGLRGPSLTLDTACSSSLVAVHLACRSLRSGESRLAIAGGVNVILQPHVTIAYSQSRMMGTAGRCRFGDAAGDGYVRSEGAGLVLLKPLRDALADGDRIYAVIRGSAINNDGRSSGSLGTPSRTGQEEMLREAYRDAGIDPASAGYSEAHGTGTRAGDPVELAALGAVLGAGRRDETPCLVGSVKTNFGHTEGAAGVAGLIKASLALHHEAVPPSLHFEQPNPAVPWATLPLRIPTALTPWPRRDGAPRVAGVSAFGIAGTNAHVVLQEAPPVVPAPSVGEAAPAPGLLVLSARSEAALRALAGRYRERLANASLRAVCAAAARRRAALPVRVAFVADDTVAMQAQLAAFANGEPVGLSGEPDAQRSGRIAMIFPGQGAQWLGMARELMAREPVFLQALQACDQAARPWCAASLIEQLQSGPGDAAWRMDRIDVIQPVLTAVAIAYARLWAHHGVVAEAVVGHSMGEVAAAHWAGALSLDDAMRVVCLRSALMQRTSGQGAMAVVELPMAEVAKRLAGDAARVSVAVSNSPGSCVISGDPQAVAGLLAGFEREQVFCRLVKVDVASHSPQMDPLVGELVDGLSGLAPRPAQLAMYSTVDVARLGGEQLAPAYWGRNLRQPVQFGETIAQMLADGIDTFIEIGPHPLLLGAVQQTAAAAGRRVTTVASGRRDEPEQATLLQGLGALWVAGQRLDAQRLWPNAEPVDLPLYPWQREHHWCEAADFRVQPGALDGALPPADGHPYLQRRLDLADTAGVVWQSELALARHAALGDHRVRGRVVFPAAAYVEATLAAAQAAAPAEAGAAWDVHELRLLAAFELPDAAPAASPPLLQVVLQPTTATRAQVEIHGRSSPAPGSPWQRQATARLVRREAAAAAAADRPTWQPAPDAARPLDDVYARLARHGLDYGTAFRGLQAVQMLDDTAWATLGLAADQVDRPTRACLACPPLFDAALQLLVLLAVAPSAGAACLLPVSIGRVRLHAPLPNDRPLQARARLHRLDAQGAAGSVVVFDNTGQCLASADDVALAWVGAPAAIDTARLLHHLVRVDCPLPASQSSGPVLLLADAHHAVSLQAAGVPAQPDHGHDGLSERVRAWCAREAAADGPRAAIVHALALSTPTDGPGTDWIESAWHTTLDTALQVLQGVQAAGLPPGRQPRCWFITRQALADAAPALGQAPLWGLVRVLQHEHPGLDATLVDLDDAAEVGAALAELLHRPPAPRQIVRRAGAWQALQLLPLERPAVLQPGSVPPSFEAHQPQVGMPERLGWRSAVRVAPGAHEVEIEVEAAGLNFLNLLSALGAYPGYPDGLGPLGIEAAGRITRLGAEVQGLQVGDPVLGVGPRCLARFATLDARLVARRPASLDACQAAGLPIVFLTAWHALHHLARLQPGETVLVHSAAGGIGLAALQVARHLGARVLATAGTADKRAWLQAQGVADVFDSRQGDFAEGVLAATGGRGVDVVLNALSGGAIAEGLRCLAIDGRFIELGKRDIYAGTPISLEPFTRSLSYHAVDLDRLMRQRPERVGALLNEVMRKVAEGVFTPLPTRVFEADALAAAFQALMPGQHIGKHVVRLAPLPSQVTLSPGDALPVRGDGTYLITGGLGALGRRVAAWLVQRGAGRIVLVGRVGVDAATDPGLQALTAQGCDVQVMTADVSDEAQVVQLLAGLRAGGPPLRGVFHAAGVLADALLADLDPAHLRLPRAAKVLGAWHLHRHTSADALDAMVFFSSVAAVLGTPGQGNYAAANAFLDALAQHRQTRGLRSLSVQLGPVADVGLAAADAQRGVALSRLGLDGLAADQAIEALDLLWGLGLTQGAAMAFDAGRWHEATRREHAAGLVAEQAPAEAAGAAAPAEVPLPDRLRAAPPGELRRNLMHGAIRQEVAEVLRLSPARVPLDRPLKSLGMDSLMALELRNRLERRTGLSLSPTLVWNHPTVVAVGEHLATRLGLALAGEAVAPASPPEAPPPEAPAPDAEVDDLVAALADLDDEELQRLLDGPAAGEGA